MNQWVALVLTLEILLKASLSDMLDNQQSFY